jgi:hypothetical protein
MNVWGSGFVILFHYGNGSGILPLLLPLLDNDGLSLRDNDNEVLTDNGI